MELNIRERYVLIGVIPERGNFETMSTIESIQKLLYPSEKEVKEFGIKQEAEAIRWNQKGELSVEIEFSETQLTLIKKTLETLSEKDNLSMSQYQIFKKLK